MINLRTLKVSKHYSNDRQMRQEQIETVVGGNWGTVIKEEYYKGAWRCLTDMGLIFIVDDSKTLIITYYLASGSIVSGMFHGNVPKYINRRISDNARKYNEIYETSIKNAI
jgi:hypothetical protein